MGVDFERAFRVAFTRSANPMALTDEERHFEEVNDALVDMLGWPRARMIGRSSQDFMRPELRAQDDARYRAFRQTGSETDLMELRTARSSFLRFLVHREAEVLPGLHLSVMLLDPAPEERLDPDEGDSEPSLSPREAEVIALVALGHGNEEIGRRLFISPETVRTHVRNAMHRRRARNRAHLIAVAMRDGLISVD